MADTTGPRHAEIVVRLTGGSGNAFGILGAVKRALKKGGCTNAEIDEFHRDALSGDYDHLLRVCMSWVTVE